MCICKSHFGQCVRLKNQTHSSIHLYLILIYNMMQTKLIPAANDGFSFFVEAYHNFLLKLSSLSESSGSALCSWRSFPVNAIQYGFKCMFSSLKQKKKNGHCTRLTAWIMTWHSAMCLKHCPVWNFISHIRCHFVWPFESDP